MDNEKLGPTGRVPRGLISPHDEGELRYGVAADAGRGVVLIDFGTPVMSLALPPENALELAEVLTRRAREISKNREEAQP